MAKVPKLNVNQMMMWVIATMIPALAFLTYWQGLGFLVNAGVAVISGLVFEFVSTSLREGAADEVIEPVIATQSAAKGKQSRIIEDGLLRRLRLLAMTGSSRLLAMTGSSRLLAMTGSSRLLAMTGSSRLLAMTSPPTILTALLFAAAVPAFASPWVLIIGMFFAIVIAKHLFGGLGHNIFNPAMVAYAVVLIAFPAEMVVWPAWALDSVSSATPLDHANESFYHHDLMPYFILNGLWLLGGLILLFKKIIRWQIPLGVLSGMMIAALFFPEPWLQFGLGATMIGAFFIATDPVTAPITPSMRFIYGFLIGVLIILLRQYSSYPDGVAFAVLLANMFTPLMDQLSIRKSS